MWMNGRPRELSAKRHETDFGCREPQRFRYPSRTADARAPAGVNGKRARSGAEAQLDVSRRVEDREGPADRSELGGSAGERAARGTR